jgi:hypothetical protein
VTHLRRIMLEELQRRHSRRLPHNATSASSKDSHNTSTLVRTAWVGSTFGSTRPNSSQRRSLWRTNGGHRTPYRGSNPTPFSSTVGHYCDMKRITHNSKTLHGSPRSAPVRPASDPIPTSGLCHTVFNHRFSLHTSACPLLYFCADSRQLQHLSFAPFNLHKVRVRRPSGFLLTAFSNARHLSKTRQLGPCALARATTFIGSETAISP